MLRPCLNCCWHSIRAVVLLVLLLCAVEVGLHLRESGDPTAFAPDGLLRPDRKFHHGLRPSLRTTLLHPDTGREVTFRTNSLGLRGPEPEIPKPPGVFRVLCLGDETVLGMEVDEQRTFCEQLRGMLQEQTRLRVEVVNAGAPKFCPLLSYLQLRHKLLALEPDLLLVHLDMSDVADDHRYRRSTVLDGDSLPIVCANERFSEGPGETAAKLPRRFLLARWIKRALGDGWREQQAGNSRQVESPQGTYAWIREVSSEGRIYVMHALSAVEQLKMLAENSASGFVLVVSPAPWQVSADASNGAGVRERAGVAHDALLASEVPFEIIRRFASQKGIVLCDTSRRFRSASSGETLFLKNAGCLSEDGHRLVAEELFAQIVRDVPGVWRENPSSIAVDDLSTRRPNRE